jgi:hypothetical protein
MNTNENMITMDYDSTTVMFNVNFIETASKEVIIEKLEKLKSYISVESELYGFVCFQNNEVIDGANCEDIFNHYIEYISANIKEDGGAHFLENPGPYSCTEWPDVEEGEMEYKQSLMLEDHGEYATIFVTMRQFYASEIEKLPNENIGISCQMVDIDGDWYEFEI